MAIEIVMPALEMAQDTALLLRWAKEEGQYVTKGEVLMEIETDKATVEIEATASGILSRVTAHAGDQIPVGQVIAVLLDETSSSSGDETPTPQHDARIADQDLVHALDDRKPNLMQPAPSSRSETRISPKARRLAQEHGLNVASVRESNQGQTLHARDISNMLGVQAEGTVPDDYATLPLKGKRKVIAERTKNSYQTAPHISLTLSIDIDEAQNRIRLASIAAKERGAVSPKLTSVFVKAAADALVAHPYLNSHLVNDEVRQYRRIDLGIAVAVDDGLVVPVLRDAGRKSAAEIESELHDLIVRARDNRLLLEEMRGSTFTVSNLGMFGIEHFSAILNPPEVGILSVGCIVERAVNKQGRTEFRPFMQVTINVDHRAIDGVQAANYLRTLKDMLEHPQSIC